MLRRRLLFATLLLPLAGCGFQLRGQLTLPPALSSLAIVGQTPAGSPPSALRQVLIKRLQTSGATVVESATDAQAVLRILEEGQNRRQLANSRQGEMREDELTYRVRFEVADRSGKLLLAPETIAASRNLLYAEARVLGRDTSEQLLQKDMLNELADTLMRRLQRIKPAHATTP